MTCNSISVLISLVAKGIGVGLLPVPCVRSLIQAGKLQVLRTKPEPKPVSFYAFMAPDNTVPILAEIARTAKSVSGFGEVNPLTLEPTV